MYAWKEYAIIASYNGMTFVRRPHDDVIQWNHFPRYWLFVRGIHGSPVNSLHKGQWRRAFTFSLLCAWINGWVNNCEAGDLRRHRAHYDVTVMVFIKCWLIAYQTNCANLSEIRRQQYRFTNYLPFCKILPTSTSQIGRVTDICVSNLEHHWFR